ncbi:protease SohB, partial [Psittacicella gerlachiana]
AKAKAQERKQQAKAQKQALKQGEQPQTKPRLYVINFKGSPDAREAQALREEITTILAVARPEQDQVLLSLESPGGYVHAYGFAASQLVRLKDKGIKLTVAVDKVAASGGYLMAVIADEIVAAPFAVVGSIGVVANVPNFNRLLKKHEVDYEVYTAGPYKRTVTMLGENTPEGKEKFKEELAQTHELFKNFVSKYRPQLDLEKVATGEHWYGQQALALNLVDKLATSDDLIQQALADKEVVGLRFKEKKSLLQKVGSQAEESSVNIVSKLFHSQDKSLY